MSGKTQQLAPHNSLIIDSVSQDGFFSLTDDCSRSCNCDPVGSTSQLCHIVTGQCPCKPNITGLMCNSPAPGNYYRSLVAALLEAEEADFTQVSTTAIFHSSNINFIAISLQSFTQEFTPPNTPVGLFTGTGFVSTSTAGNITFVLTVPKSSQYEILLRYRVSYTFHQKPYQFYPLLSDFKCCDRSEYCYKESGTSVQKSSVYKSIEPAYNI